MLFSRIFRYFLTRCLVRAMGIRIEYWRRTVEKLWSLDSRDQYLESYLKSVAPQDCYGNRIETLSELNEASILTKKCLAGSSLKRPIESRFDRHTAGTSGTPTEVWLNRRELSQMLGVRDYCYRHCGIRVGDREGRVWARPEKGLKSRIKNFSLNRQVFHTSGEDLTREVKNLIRWRPVYVYGYSSLLIECAREMEETGRFITGLKCVIVTAEAIFPSQKKYLGRIFGCPVYEEYGSSEFDIIAFECSSGHCHLVNPWLILESGPEQQLVVSDVCRTSQPFIRYELGDIVLLEENRCEELGSSWVISSLKGRSSSQFALSEESKKFHAVEFGRAVDHFQKEYGELFQFTVLQRSPGCFDLLCNPIPVAGNDILARYVERSILETANCKIEIKVKQGSESEHIKRTYFEDVSSDDGGI